MIKIFLIALTLTACSSNQTQVVTIEKKVVPLVRNTYGLGAIEDIKIGNEIISSWRFLPISTGDKLQISINNSDKLSGIYEVGFDGFIQIPFIEPLKASEKSAKTLESTIKNALVEQGIMIARTTQVSVRLKQYSTIKVKVKGGVFSPGEVLVNSRLAKKIALKASVITGDNAQKRLLSTALKAASGVTPYADLKNIILKRNNQLSRYDLSGIFTGEPVNDVPLVQHDIIIVPTFNRIQRQYLRPSRVTPPGFDIITSSIGEQSNITAEQISLVYGSTLFHAAQKIGCVGGGISSNNRQIMLISQDIQSKKFKPNLVQSIDNLLKNVNNSAFNPYLTMFDSVACFESNLGNVREVFKLLTDIVQPIYLYKNL